MSVAQYQVPNAVAAGASWGANPNMQAPNMNQASGSGISNVRVPVEPLAQSNDSRGERSGEVCLSFDLFANADTLVLAQWSEEACECTSAVHNSNQVVSFSAEGRELLLTSELSTKDLYQSGDISVNNALSTHDGKLYPMSDVCSADAVERSPYIEVGQSGKVQLAGLVSLIVVHAAHLHQDSFPDMGLHDKPKKGKAGKKGKKKQQSVTLICPVGFNQTQRAALISAANQADFAVKDIFNRAVAAVAGGLYGASRANGKNTLIGALSQRAAEETGSIVLYLNATFLSGESAGVMYEAALVRCEGARGAQQVGAMLGCERLSTVASSCGRLQQCGAAGADADTAEQLHKIVKQLCSAHMDDGKVC